MIDQEETAKLNAMDLVVCRDEYGLYTTERNRLNNGCADPNRYCSVRLEGLYRSREKE